MRHAAAAVLIAVTAASMPAAAQSPPTDSDIPSCGQGVVAWVRAAGRATEIAIRPVRCVPGNVRVTLTPTGAPPIDVEIADPPGPAFRHAGRLRVSPIVEVADYSMLPEPQRHAYEALVDWLTEHGDELGDIDPAQPQSEPMGPWLPLLAIALLLMVAGRLGRVPRGDVAAAAALLSVAAALRYGLGLFGPLHVNGQGPLWIAGATESWLLRAYGPGYPELFSGVARLQSIADGPIFTANLWFAAAAAPLGFALARGLGMTRGVALILGAVLALDPVTVVYFVSESYLPAIVAFLLATQLSLAVAAGCHARRDRLNTAVALLAAGLFASAAARIHPVSYLPTALSALVVLAVPSRRDLKSKLGLLSLAGLAVGGTVLATSHAVVQAVLESALHHSRTAHEFTAFEVLLLAAVGATALALRKRWLGSQAGWLAFVALAAAFATREVYGQQTHWQLAYDRLFLPMIALGAIAWLPSRVGRIVPGTLVVAIATAALLYPAYALLIAPPTEMAEYRFVRQALASAPPGCTLASVERIGSRVTLLPHYAIPPAPDGSRRRISLEAPTDLAAAATPGRCLRYVHSSLCNSLEGRPICEAIEASLELEELERLETAPQVSYLSHRYDRDPVEIIVYRPTPPPR